MKSRGARRTPPFWLSRPGETVLESIPCGGLLFGHETHTPWEASRCLLEATEADAEGLQLHRPVAWVRRSSRASRTLARTRRAWLPRSAGCGSLVGGGVGGPWSCALPLRAVRPHRSASASRGAVGGGPPAQVVAPLRGPAAGPLHGHPPAQAGGQADHVLLVVVVPSHGVQQLIERLPADWAGSCPPGPLPDAGKAETVEAEGHVGCLFDVSQADGALGVRCCLRRPCLGRLAHAAGPCSRAALHHGFLGVRRCPTKRDMQSAGACLAGGALGLALSPPQDARVAGPVAAWHHKAGLLPAAQADGTAVLQLRGHALHVLRWAGGSWRGRAAPSHWRCSSGCGARKGRESRVIGCRGEEWKKCPGPSRRKPSQLPTLRFPRPAHLRCCERAAWVPRLPEPGRAGANPSTALGSGTESCKELLPEHDTGTKGLAQCSTPCELAQLECRHEPAG